MSALAMILVTGMVVGSGPEKMLGEIDQLLDLSGQWEGTSTWGKKTQTAILCDSVLCTSEWSRLSISSWKAQTEGRGRCRVIDDDIPRLGIYEWRGSWLFLCYRTTGEGRPTSFKAGENDHLLTLHRVKPRK